MLKVKPVLKLKPVLKHKQDSGWRAGLPWVMVGRKGGTPRAGVPQTWGEAGWSRGPSAEAAEPVLGLRWCPEPCAAFQAFPGALPCLGTP